MNNYLKTIDNVKVPVSKEVYSQINSIQNRTNYVTRRLKEWAVSRFLCKHNLML